MSSASIHLHIRRLSTIKLLTFHSQNEKANVSHSQNILNEILYRQTKICDNFRIAKCLNRNKNQMIDLGRIDNIVLRVLEYVIRTNECLSTK